MATPIIKIARIVYFMVVLSYKLRLVDVTFGSDRSAQLACRFIQ